MKIVLLFTLLFLLAPAGQARMQDQKTSPSLYSPNVLQRDHSVQETPETPGPAIVPGQSGDLLISAHVLKSEGTQIEIQSAYSKYGYSVSAQQIALSSDAGPYKRNVLIRIYDENLVQLEPTNFHVQITPYSSHDKACGYSIRPHLNVGAIVVSCPNVLDDTIGFSINVYGPVNSSAEEN